MKIKGDKPNIEKMFDKNYEGKKRIRKCRKKIKRNKEERIKDHKEKT